MHGHRTPCSNFPSVLLDNLCSQCYFRLAIGPSVLLDLLFAVQSVLVHRDHVVSEVIFSVAPMRAVRALKRFHSGVGENMPLQLLFPRSTHEHFGTGRATVVSGT